MTSFSTLGLDPALIQALDAEGYVTPTPIQAQAIPSLLEGRDLLGIAQTGTGKTAAFALPILHRLAASRRPAPRNGARALILSPTRELATQIGESFKTYGRHMGFSVAVVFGGVGYKPQTEALRRGLDVLVATPGRLIDHMNEGHANLGSTEILVLDEADQMMDLGFIRPLRQIISKLSARRQSMFFSATMPHEIGALAAELLRDPVKVAVTPVAKTADRVSQRVIHVESQKKRALLVELFAADPGITRALVFTRTKRGADRVARHLEGAGIAVAAIHGNKSQGQRETALANFKSSRIRALIATDIAARGIDIDQVSHVFNYELPNIPESYVHRIGRTARAGAEGIAISFCDGEERAYLKDIERLIRQTIPSEDRRGDASLEVASESGGRGGERPGAGNGSHGRSGQGRRDRGEAQSRGHGHPHPGQGRNHDRARQAQRGEGGEQRDHARPAQRRPDAPRGSQAHGGKAGEAPLHRSTASGRPAHGAHKPRERGPGAQSKSPGYDGNINSVAFLNGSRSAPHVRGGSGNEPRRRPGATTGDRSEARPHHSRGEHGGQNRHRPRPGERSQARQHSQHRAD